MKENANVGNATRIIEFIAGGGDKVKSVYDELCIREETRESFENQKASSSSSTLSFPPRHAANLQPLNVIRDSLINTATPTRLLNVWIYYTCKLKV